MKLAPPGVGAPAGVAASGTAQHSLVLASDFLVDDVEQAWSVIQDNDSPLAGLGAHHVVLYISSVEPNRVLVTIGIRHRTSVEELLRSPKFFEWFDRAGVSDLPAIFAGEVLEKVDVIPPGADPSTAGVIVGAVGTVGDVAEVMARVHDGVDRFRDAGVRKIWVYRAIDDGHEVMTLLEVDGAPSAQRWIDRPDTAAEWMSGVGIGGYPRPFVGKLAYVTDLANQQPVRQG